MIIGTVVHTPCVGTVCAYHVCLPYVPTMCAYRVCIPCMRTIKLEYKMLVMYLIRPTYISPLQMWTYSYVYAILDSKVEAAKGKAIIRKNESTLMPKTHMLICKRIMLSLPKHHQVLL
jgi:hypothetical protein